MESKAPPFTTVPLELREQIYSNLRSSSDDFPKDVFTGGLHDDFPKDVFTGGLHNNPGGYARLQGLKRLAGLSESCRFFYQDVTDYYYRHVTFKISLPDQVFDSLFPSKTDERHRNLRVPLSVHERWQDDLTAKLNALKRLRRLRVHLSVTKRWQDLVEVNRLEVESLLKCLRIAKGEHEKPLLDTLIVKMKIRRFDVDRWHHPVVDEDFSFDNSIYLSFFDDIRGRVGTFVVEEHFIDM